MVSWEMLDDEGCEEETKNGVKEDQNHHDN